MSLRQRLDKIEDRAAGPRRVTCEVVFGEEIPQEVHSPREARLIPCYTIGVDKLDQVETKKSSCSPRGPRKGSNEKRRQ